MRHDRLLHWVLLAPAMALIIGMLYLPMLGTIWESFHETTFLNPNPQFVGFDLYEKVVTDKAFTQVVANSLLWTLGVVLLQNLFGFAAALLLNQRLPFQGLLRAIVLLPFILPGVVTAILWRFMYDPQLGLVNAILLRTGAIDTSVAWLADPGTAMASVILAAVWKGFPFSMLIYLAALQNVDQSQIEAAILDGAGPLRRLFDVILPAIRDVVVVNMVLTLILTFNYFDIIWVLTGGGPQSLTHIFPTKIFETGFGQFRFGEAATYGVFSILVLSVLVAAYALLQAGASRRRASA